jgi:hypothetical protein
MSFKLSPLAGDRWRLEFTGEPEYVHALMMAPESREAELDSGIWLVVAFPIWSGPVRHSVVSAVACAKEFNGRFQLGVRPFDHREEIASWWPGGQVPSQAELQIDIREDVSRREVRITSDPSASPIWLVLRDGQVMYQGAGPRSREELATLVRSNGWHFGGL